MFLYNDQAPVTLASGAGGSGAVSFRRSRKLPRGGPDGGDGGAGGNIELISAPHINNLNHLKKKPCWRAPPGAPGGSQGKTGRDGRNLAVSLPPGTVVRDRRGKILLDLAGPPKRAVFLKGGRGGRGNAFFKTSANQAPQRAQKGEPGRETPVVLEMKPMIHAALTGKANAGKSAFFNRVTGGRSPEAPYPYTTLEPWIGSVKGFSPPCLLMDIPGLQKGAHRKISGGLAFLRSIQRAAVLLHFIEAPDPDFDRSCGEIEEEMRAFDKKFSKGWPSPLSEKKRFLVLSKIDLIRGKGQRAAGPKPLKIRAAAEKRGLPLFPVSSLTGEGVKELLSALEGALAAAPAPLPERGPDGRGS